MPLYKRLKENDLVEDQKEYQELVLMRQIHIDNKPVEDPKTKLEEGKKYSLRIGILEVEL